jgi:hypothetical protein
MFLRAKKTQPIVCSFLPILTLFFLFSNANVEAVGLTDNPSVAPSDLTPVQYYPRPYHYPPGYYPPTQDPYQGNQGARGSGWIFIEVEPPEAAVFIDGHKLEPREDNTYEEGVLTGRHKVEAKKQGYRDYLRFIDIHPGTKENLTINLKKIE